MRKMADKKPKKLNDALIALLRQIVREEIAKVEREKPRSFRDRIIKKSGRSKDE